MAASSIKCSTSYTLVHVADGTGVTISETSVKYALSSSGTTTPSDSEWKEKSQITPEGGKYLWTWTHVEYSDGSVTDSFSTAYIGTDGKDGDDGVGISSITKTESTADSGKNTVTITLTNGKKETFTVTNGSKGSQGDKGLTGAYTLYQYYASTSDTTPTGGSWSSTMPSIANTGKYLWMRTQTVPAGGSESADKWSSPVVAGTDISTLMAKINTVDGKTQTNATAITANADAIAKKVSTDTFNALGSRVTAAESNISQNATDIALKVSTDTYTTGMKNKADKTTVDNLTTRVGTAEASITANSNLIKQKVSTEVYDAKVKTLEDSISDNADNVSALETKVTNAETTIEQNASSISLRVSTVETTQTDIQNTLKDKADSSTVTDLSTRVADAETNIETRATKSELELTQNMIALRVVSGSSSLTDAENNTITGITIKDGKIQLNAEETIVSGTIKSSQISSEAITAEKLTSSCISGKSFLVGDTTDSEGTKVLGSIRSSAYDKNGENATKAKGFFLNSEGVLRATDATFNSVHITDGELASPSLQTSNASTQAAWCASPAFPDENGKSSSAIKVLKKETDTALTSVGTLTFTNSITGYWRASDLVTWLENNIPVNNTAFTKLTGTFDGYNAYARRCDADTWTQQFSYSISDRYGSTDTNTSEQTFNCGVYYCYLKVALSATNNNSWTDKASMNFQVYVDGTEKWTGAIYSKGSINQNIISNLELSPGTHTVRIVTKAQTDSVVSGSFVGQTSITSVYGVDAGGIELRLYSGTDDSIVFSGGTSDNRLNVVAVNEDTSSGSKTYRLWLDDSFASTYYKYIPVNLTYGSSTFKGGNGLTGWTTTRYEPFPGLYKIGQYNETSKEVEWASGTLSLRDSCVYKVSSVVVDGTLYQKDFNVSWNKSVLLLTSEDGQNSWSYTKDAYYSSFPCISYVEIGFAKGVYVFSLYPKVAKESDIGSSNQPFDSVYATNFYGTGNIDCGVFKYNHEDTVLEVGQAIDFHRVGDTQDYSARIHADGVNQMSFYVNQTRVCYINTNGLWGAVAN